MSEQMNNYEVNNNGAEAPTNGFAIASLVVGIVSIVLTCVDPLICIICGIVGIVLSVIAKKKMGSSGMGTAGLICSIVGIVIAVIIFILVLVGYLGAVAALQ